MTPARHGVIPAAKADIYRETPHRELGPDWQRKRYSVEHRARRLQRQLEALGYTVTIDATTEIQPAA